MCIGRNRRMSPPVPDDCIGRADHTRQTTLAGLAAAHQPYFHMGSTDIIARRWFMNAPRPVQNLAATDLVHRRPRPMHIDHLADAAAVLLGRAGERRSCRPRPSAHQLRTMQYQFEDIETLKSVKTHPKFAV
jgi:hypothetical protein